MKNTVNHKAENSSILSEKIYIASTQQRVYKTGRVHLYGCSYTCISKDLLGHQGDTTILAEDSEKKAIYHSLKAA